MKFCFDPHIHSRYSIDGILSPEQIIKIACSKGLNAVAITDHNTIKGGLQVKSIKQDKIIIIVGSEIKTDFGDVIGLFLNEEINSRNFGEVIDEIKAQDGITVLPHPYRRKRFPGFELLENIDLIESLNGRTSERLNLKAQKLAKELKKPMIAGSDAHLSFELGRISNIIKTSDMTNSNSEEELRKTILKGKAEMNGKALHPLIRNVSILIGATIKKFREI